MQAPDAFLTLREAFDQPFDWLRGPQGRLRGSEYVADVLGRTIELLLLIGSTGEPSQLSGCTRARFAAYDDRVDAGRRDCTIPSRLHMQDPLCQ